MKSKIDSSGNIYIDVENIRVTYILASKRTGNKNWSNSDVIRIQSYKGDVDKSLHIGAELPIDSPETFGQFVAAICQVYAEVKGK